MSKNTLLSELINYISANASGNVVVAAPTSGLALDVTGSGRFTGQLTLGSTITNGTFTYTLPSATGTLALTSALSAYLPLTGGTLTGGLNGTTATLSGSASTNALVINQSSGFFALQVNQSGVGAGIGINQTGNTDGLLITHTGGRGIRINSANTGFGIIINNETASTSVPFIIQKQGADRITFTDAGAGTFVSTISAAGATLTGALNGTSATFSSSLSLTRNSNSGTAISITNTDGGSSAIAEYVLNTNSSGFASLGKNSSTRDGAGIIDPSDTFLYSEGGGSISVFNNFSSGQIRFAAGASTSAHFTIASTGAATFSSSVTATRLTVATENSGVIVDLAGRHGLMKYANYATGLVGINTGTDANISTWLGRFSGSITSPTGIFQDLVITTSGNVGIGTTSIDSRLMISSGSIRALRIDTNSGVQGISMSPNAIFGIDEPGVGNGRFIINTNGRVGIGTGSPGAKLEVIGDIRAGSYGLNSDSVFRGGLYPYRFISGTGTDYGVTIFAEGGTGNGNIYFCPGGSATRAATITTGGSLLLGTTSNFSNLRLQVAGRIYTEGIVGYSYSQTSTSGSTSIVDTYIDNNSFGQSAMYMISYGGNPNAGGSGAYKVNYVGYISVATGWSGSNVTRYIRYTPVAQFDAPNVGALSLSVFFFNGSNETASINEQSTAGYYIRLKITGYNTSFVGSEQYVYLTKLN